MTALVSAIAEVRQAVGRARDRNLKVGLVPTMGALHAGHVSLIRAARAETGFVVVSIFVNPTQFGPGEDFNRYPRPLEADLDVCRREGVDLVFAPAAETMYPADFHTYVEVHHLQDVLCGPSRPGHFRGVATVVCKLFNIVQPDLAYFGQKDFQQARIIQQLVRDLNLPLEVRICPTIREPDGLALSSRNRYLNGEQRRHATVLYRSLQEVKAAVEKGERDPVALQRRLAERITATPGAILDYAEVRSAETLRTQPRLQGEVLVAVAVKFGGTRLIDNVLLQVSD
jgi:pantoate--beta-alanine ligase